MLRYCNTNVEIIQNKSVSRKSGHSFYVFL